MKVSENKKNHNHISLLVIKSLPKKKYQSLKPSTQSYVNSYSNFDIHQPPKEINLPQTKPNVINLEFDIERKKREVERRKGQRKLLSSACIQQQGRRQNQLISRETLQLQRKHNLQEFVMQNLHIGACDVKKMSCDYDFNPRRLPSYKLKKQFKPINYGNSAGIEMQSYNKVHLNPSRTIYTTRNFCRNILKAKRSQTAIIKNDQIKNASENIERNLQIYEKNVEKNQFLPLRKPAKKDYFVFGLSEKNLPENKIQIYRDFLWKVNFSNDLYVVTPETNDYGYKAFIGLGNNSIMVKGILKRRFWWSIVDKPINANFVWAQLKVNSFFLQQNPSDYLRRIQPLISSDQIIDQELLQDEHKNIFRINDLKIWKQHMEKNSKTQEKISQQTYIKRMAFAQKKLLTKIQNPANEKSHNHFENNFYLGNKKALFYNLRRFYQLKNQNVFTIIPTTFHITKGIEDPEYQNFLDHYAKLENIKQHDRSFRNIWIAKPGENTNRGNGISVCFSIDDVRLRLRGKQKNSDGKPRTFIIQKYIEKPLLYQGRKFDIRHYLLICCINGDFKGYWYEEGYIRTSSSAFSLRNTKDLFTHLTNDAIQKHGDQYGKYEKGNKLSYQQFQNYLTKHFKKKKINFFKQILPKMKQIALDAVKSTYLILDPQRRERNFQLFGLDFMIDEEFRPWLIQCNTNPCLQLSCPLLGRLIPNVIENVFRLCVDPIFPPPETWQNGRRQFFGDNPLLQNKFELIFDEKTNGGQIMSLFVGKSIIDDRMGKIQEDDQLFENDGNQKWEENIQN